MSTSTATLTSSTRDAADACLRHVIPAGEPWVGELTAGQTMRLLDLEGNQAVDTLFFSARQPARALRPAAHAAPPAQPLPHHRHRALLEPGQRRC